MKNLKNTLIIPPQGKRKYKIIIEAIFNDKIKKEEQDKLNLEVAKILFDL
jgi:hypothetical protein